MRKIIWFVLDRCLIIGFLLFAWKFRWLFWGRWPGIRVNEEGSRQGWLVFLIVFCAHWPFQLAFQIFLEEHFSFSSLYFGIIRSGWIFLERRMIRILCNPWKRELEKTWVCVYVCVCAHTCVRVCLCVCMCMFRVSDGSLMSCITGGMQLDQGSKPSVEWI